MEIARSAAKPSRSRADVPFAPPPPASWLELSAEKMRTLGCRIVQVERTERHRFEVPRRS